MSVLDNVLVGMHGRHRLGGRRRALEVLAEVGLEGIAYRSVAVLPFGTQKRVELARALASEPRLLLLDEPAGGLNHEEGEELGSLIRRIRRDFTLTVILVEHHMGLVMGASDRVHVLNFWRKVASGAPAAVQRN